jgi:hypothetical protein
VTERVNEPRPDALTLVSAMRVVIAYAPRLRPAALWCPDQDLLVLAADRSRDQLSGSVEKLLAQICRDRIEEPEHESAAST